MKKLFVILSAASALILAGYDKGGTSDQYGTGSGNANGSGGISNSVHDGAPLNTNNTTP